jgi:hypothetical protein
MAETRSKLEEYMIFIVLCYSDSVMYVDVF